jgi:hypothetical protein
MFVQLISLYRQHKSRGDGLIVREFTNHIRELMKESILPADQQMPGLGSDGRFSRGTFMRVMKKPGPLMFLLV